VAYAARPSIMRALVTLQWKHLMEGIAIRVISCSVIVGVFLHDLCEKMAEGYPPRLWTRLLRMYDLTCCQ
jgi:hypothetical protein